MRALGPTLIALFAPAALGGCAPCDASVALYFPTQAAHDAVKWINVYVYSLEGGGVNGAHSCSDLMATSGDKVPMGGVQQGFAFPFTQAESLNKVAAGKQLVYVLASESSSSDAAILAGCTDRFDSRGGSDQCSNVPIQLHVVLPDGSHLVKVAGDHQVGAETTMLPVPLTVGIQAVSAGGTQYLVPGVKINFSSADPDFQIMGATNGSIDVVAGPDGKASVEVTLPARPKTGSITAKASVLSGMLATQTFSVSVTPAVRFPAGSKRTITAHGVPIALAIGHVTGGAGPDLVELSCQGSGAACARGAAAKAAPGTGFGTAALSVFTQVATTPTPFPVTPGPGGLGILPAGLALGKFVAASAAQDAIAILDSRRADCQARVCPAGKDCACFGVPPGGACPCEGSEVRILALSGGAIALDHRVAITASNGIGLAAFHGLTSVAGSSSTALDLAVAGQGRARNDRACNLSNDCLPYDSQTCRDDPSRCACSDPTGRSCDGALCLAGTASCACTHNAQDPCLARRHPETVGCPPGDHCDGSLSSTVGRCRAHDKTIDILANRLGRPSAAACSPANPGGACGPGQVCQQGACVAQTYFNYRGCTSPQLSCGNVGATRGTCQCLDTYDGNSCGAMDLCGCPIPDRIALVAGQNKGDASPDVPYGIAAGPLRSDAAWDFVVGVSSGFLLFQADPLGTTFGGVTQPTVNAPIDEVLVTNLDSAVDGAADIAWAAQATCLAGGAYDEQCPTFRPVAQGATAVGCIGVFYTSGAESVFKVNPPMSGGCRRYFETVVPDSLCAADFNGDGAIDLAFASHSSNQLFVATGDGRGGLLDPPQQFALPSGGVGGPIACADLDGDGKADAVVADVQSGALYVLLTGG